MLRTRRRHTDDTVILAPGEYDFGEAVEGAIDYGATELVPVVKLVAQIRSNRAQMKTPLSSDLLDRVAAGLRASAHTPNWVAAYLKRSGRMDLMEDVGLDSLGIAQLVATLEVELKIDPFASRPFAGVRTIDDFTQAYWSALNERNSGP